jgi:hypothetical protein
MNAPQTVRKLFSRSTSRAFSIWGGAIVVAMLLGQTVSATPVAIYDSINGSTSIGFVTADSNIWLGNNFKTDASTYDLNSVVLDFAAVPSGGDIGVDIYSDVSGKPGSSLGTLTNPGSFAAGSNTFTTSGIPLASASSFWVVLQGVGFGAVDWNSTSSIPTGVGSSIGKSFSSNSGVSWGTASGSPYMMTVYATSTSSPVPEIDPASFGSALSLLLGSLTLLERRRRQG